MRIRRSSDPDQRLGVIPSRAAITSGLGASDRPDGFGWRTPNDDRDPLTIGILQDPHRTQSNSSEAEFFRFFENLDSELTADSRKSF